MKKRLISVLLAVNILCSLFAFGVNAATNPFKDVKSGEYYYDAVLWAVDKGVTTGTSSTTFTPNKDCTRAEVVTFLWRAQGKPAPSSSKCAFTDVEKGSWYYDAVLWAAETGVTTGTSATTFAPTAIVTRSQFVTFLWRAMGKPAASKNTSFGDVSKKTDSNSWYYDAVMWAAASGVTTGTGDGNFSPAMNCSRGQTVTFLYRAQNSEKRLAQIIQYGHYGNDDYYESYSFSYDSNGNITSISSKNSNGWTNDYDYTYDDKNRIVSYIRTATDFVTNEFDYGFVYPDTTESDRKKMYEDMLYVQEFDSEGKLIKRSSNDIYTVTLYESDYVYSKDRSSIQVTTRVSSPYADDSYRYETHKCSYDNEGRVVNDVVQGKWDHGTYSEEYSYYYDYAPFVIETTDDEGVITSMAIALTDDYGKEIWRTSITGQVDTGNLKFYTDADGDLSKIEGQGTSGGRVEFIYTGTASAENNTDKELDLLTDYYWYLNIQSWEIYSFNEDGTYDIYWCEMPLMPPTENTTFSPDELTPALGGGTYTFDEDRLVLRKDNSNSELVMDLYNKNNNPAKSLGDAETDIEEYRGNYYFYQTDWEPRPEWPSDNASYLVRLGAK